MAEEKITKNITLLISIGMFLFTVLAGGIAYGELKNQTANTCREFNEHKANQSTTEKAQSENNKDLAVGVGKLATQVESLTKSIDALNRRLDRR